MNSEILKSNIHSHTTFADGKNTAEEMVHAALARGFHTLGFSEHGHADYDDCSMRAEDEPAYRAEILRLKEAYRGQIHLLLGLEHDWFAPADLSYYDYVIESVHYIRHEGALICVDDTRAELESALVHHFSGDAYALCRAYFDTVCDTIQHSKAQVLGHIELIMKFNGKRDLFDDGDPRYLRAALETAELAARSGKIIEINTGAMARGYLDQPYPGAAMLRRIAQAGGRVMLSSDCHNADYIDHAFEPCAALARACGFRSLWQYRGGALVECPLD